MTIEELVYLDANGYFFADYPSFLEYLKDSYRAIYGNDVYLEADSQDGQWLAIVALALYNCATQGASTYNSFSPATAQGIGLSRNVKINGISRRLPTNSTADVDIVGVVGTVITNGVVIDTLEQKWDVPDSVITSGGTITVTVTAQEIGAVQAAPGTINRIFTPTLGWQSVTNVLAATPGEPVETDAELRVRQTQSVANPSLTVLDGTVGAVFNLTGVTNVRAYENDTNATDSDGLPPHSITLIVEGGDVTEIAEAIALHKTPGTATNGTTAQLVYDAKGMPLTIRFSRPVQVDIIGEITIVAKQGYSADYADLIAQAVADQINAFGIGSDVILTKLYAPAYLLGTPASATFDISDLEIAISGDPLGTANIPIDFDELPVCDPNDITIVVL